MTRLAAGVVIGGMVGALMTAAQEPPTFAPDVEKHFAAARAAAGADHVALYDSVCGSARTLLAPPAGRAGAGRAGGPPAPPPRDAWHAAPVKVFDNLYYVGMTDYSAWAIATSEGIILLDAIYDYSVEDEVVGGLKTLGLDPARIKYVVVSHGHGDHAGGAKYLQDRFGSRLVMSAADYDLLDRQNPPWKPRRDIVATDGMPLTLGDTTLTLYLTPGHTEGTISAIVPLRDGSARHVAATWGGTSFNFGPIKERVAAYAASAVRHRDIATKAGADVILSNHPANDRSKTKLPAMLARQPGQPHPYVVGTEVVRRYLTVAEECGLAAIAGL